MYQEKIRSQYNEMSRSYRTVSDFILGNYRDVIFMTAAELAAAAGVDTTTVVRMAQHIGYAGYPAMLNDIRTKFKQETFPQFNRQSLVSDSYLTMVGCLENDQNNIADAIQRVSPQQMLRVETMISDATDIMVFADGYAELPAQLFVEQLCVVPIAASFVPHEPIKRAAMLLRLTADTLVIGATGSDERLESVSPVLKLAQERGCSTLGIVGSLESPVYRIADEAIVTPTSSAGPLKTVTTMMSVMNAIVQIVRADTPEKEQEYFGAFSEIYQTLV